MPTGHSVTPRDFVVFVVGLTTAGVIFLAGVALGGRISPGPAPMAAPPAYARPPIDTADPRRDYLRQVEQDRQQRELERLRSQECLRQFEPPNSWQPRCSSNDRLTGRGGC